MRILLLGTNGMLGHALYRVLAERETFEVLGTVRSFATAANLPRSNSARIVDSVTVEQNDRMRSLIGDFRPDAIINCIGAGMNASLAEATMLNSELPHRLAKLARDAGARLIHIGTDGVFSGKKGGYTEADLPDPIDIYGKSKLIGEVSGLGCLTLRTSIIGPELGAGKGLLSWFLAQTNEVKGFRRAIFSGFPTVELARVIADDVLPRPDLHGILHIASTPITKFDLLKLIAKHYDKDIAIIADDTVTIDRSLDSSHFSTLTGYHSPEWNDLVMRMHDFG